MKVDIFISKYSLINFAYMDSTRLYRQFGTGVSRLDSLTVVFLGWICAVKPLIMRRRKKMRKTMSKYQFILTLQRLLPTTTHGAYHCDASQGNNDL
jgi:hypothetical protein